MKSTITILLAISLNIISAQTPPLEWVKTLEGLDEKTIVDADLDEQDNIFLKGFFKSTVDFDPGPDSFLVTSQGIGDGYMLQLDYAGNLKWFEALPSESENSGSALKVNGLKALVTGRTFGMTFLGSQAFLAPNSDTIAHYLNSGVDIDFDKDGNILITGGFSQPIDFDPSSNELILTPLGNSDVYFVKLSPNGNLIWAKQIGGTQINSGTIIKADSEGNIILAGVSNGQLDFDPNLPGNELITDGGYFNNFISKYDSSGDLIWFKHIGGIGNKQLRETYIDEDDNIILVGNFYETLDFKDPSNSLVFNSNGGADIFIATIDASGSYLWANALGADKDQYMTDVTKDKNGDIYTTGAFYGEVDFDPGNNIHLLESNGFTDIFIQKYNNAGEYITTYQIGGTSFEYGNVIRTDSENNIVLFGQYGKEVDFDLSANEFIQSALGPSDAFVAKYSTCLNTTTSLDYSSCDSLSINNVVYHSSGSYIQYLNSMAGCDSTLHLNITIHESYDSQINIESCDHFYWPITDSLLTETGSYQAILNSENGCDSLINLFLEILPSKEIIIQKAICEGEEFEGYTVSGTYEDVFTAASGCDSVRTLTLEVIGPVLATVEGAICEGEEFEGYTVSGTYEDVFTAASGCDSVRTLTLEVIGPVLATVEGAICEGEEFEGYTVSGTYEDVFTAANGCDSVRTLILTVLADSDPACMNTATDEADAASLTIYPNPTSKILYIDSKHCASMVVQFVSLNGKVFQENRAKPLEPINMSSLKNGVYLVKVCSDEGCTVKKIIKFDK